MDIAGIAWSERALSDPGIAPNGKPKNSDSEVEPLYGVVSMYDD